jgi:hypothetical protein
MDQHKFVGLRFFLVPVEDSLFTKPASDVQKSQWFQESFLQSRDFDTKGAAEFALRLTTTEGSLFFGKISRKRVFERHEKTPSDIKDVRQEDWPYLLFVCDTRPGIQLLVIEYKSSFGFTVGHLAEVLAELANQRLFTHGYAASFEPIVGEESFWNIVQSSEGVYALTFHLASPNLFWATSAANEGLRELQKHFNNNRVSIALFNDKGKLKTPRNQIETYRDYADRGGGNWKITIQTKKRRKRSFKSADKAIKITIEAEDGETLAILGDAIKQFSSRL